MLNFHIFCLNSIFLEFNIVHIIQGEGVYENKKLFPQLGIFFFGWIPLKDALCNLFCLADTNIRGNKYLPSMSFYEDHFKPQLSILV